MNTKMFTEENNHETERLPNGNVKFTVHNVTVATKRDERFKRPTPIQPLKKAFEKYGRVEYVSEKKESETITLQTFTDNNAFAEAVFIAFYEHFPLRISPDVLWITILQGLAIHVNENSEALRSTFVNHEGKKTISIFRPDIVLGSKRNDWEGTITDFLNGIHENVHENVHPMIDTTFSTTTATDRTCMNIAVMDATKSYFTLVMRCGCGIPYIELTGTPEDWTRLRHQASLLRRYELDWWIDELDEVLAYFERAGTGMISVEDKKFWRSVVYLTGGSGMLGDPITGWMQTFFPYIQADGGKFQRNTAIGQWKHDTIQSTVPRNGRELRSGRAGHAIKLKHFPSGINQAPFLLVNVATQEKSAMCYAGGLTSIVQGKEDHVLEVQTGWAVVEVTK